MAKHYEPGSDDAADAADRPRPPVTHREVPDAEVQAERDRVPQNDLGTRVGDLDSGDRLERMVPDDGRPDAEVLAPDKATKRPARRTAAKKK
jgi:hypothetical protein